MSVCDNPLASPVLAPRYYTDPAVFEEERTCVFHASWLYMCHASEVAEPGCVLPRTLHGEPLVVVRNRDGALNVFHNVCQHRAMQVVSGPDRRNVLQCPYHGWIYDLDGRLVGARRTAHLEAFDRTSIALLPVRSAEIDSFVFVNIDGTAPPAEEVLRPVFADARACGVAPANLVKARHIDHEINANWKVVIDNFVESYHTEVAHPGYCAFADFDNAFVEDGPWHTLMGGPPAGHVLEAHRRDGTLDVTANRYNWAWPTTMVLLSPGPANLFIWEAIPLSWKSTVFRHTFFFDRPEGELLPEQQAHIAMDGALQAEDTVLVEGVWRGLKSVAAPRVGRYVINDEETQHSERAVWRFHRRLQEIYGSTNINRESVS